MLASPEPQGLMMRGMIVKFGDLKEGKEQAWQLGDCERSWIGYLVL